MRTWAGSPVPRGGIPSLICGCSSPGALTRSCGRWRCGGRRWSGMCGGSANDKPHHRPVPVCSPPRPATTRTSFRKRPHRQTREHRHPLRPSHADHLLHGQDPRSCSDTVTEQPLGEANKDSNERASAACRHAIHQCAATTCRVDRVRRRPRHSQDFDQQASSCDRVILASHGGFNADLRQGERQLPAHVGARRGGGVAPARHAVLHRNDVRPHRGKPRQPPHHQRRGPPHDVCRRRRAARVTGRLRRATLKGRAR